MKKKYMIRCDIEGATGVVSPWQAEPDKPEFPFGQRMFMSDLLAMVGGLFDGGADEVHIYDEHFYGRNVDLGALPERVAVYCGKPPYRPDWAGGLDENFSGLLLLGFHSMADSGGLLCHTYEPDIQAIEIGGVSVGEIGLEAAIAGQFGVPLQLVTADSAGIEEARRLVPGTLGVSVKESLGEDGAACYPPRETARWIREAARQVVEDPPPSLPYTTESPVSLRIRLRPGTFSQRMHALYSDVVNNGEVLLVKETVLEAYASYWRMKLRCQ